jgi:filamentous hemagglutinin family protein
MKFITTSKLKFISAGKLVLSAAVFLNLLPNAFALDDVTVFQADDCGVGCGYSDNGASADINFTKNNATVSFDTLSLSSGEQLNANGSQAGWNILINVKGDLPSIIEGGIGGNAGHLVLSNPKGIVFDGASIMDIGQIVATTGTVNNFSSGGYTISGLAQGGIIDILDGGLSSNVDGGQVALVAPKITINGDVTLTASEFLAIAGATASITFNNGLMQIDITEALASSQTAIEVLANKTITATNIELQAALAADPLALAINQRGILKATGLSDEGGVIRLHGSGARVLVAGELDTRNAADAKAGEVDLAGNTVMLAGNIVSDSVNVELGEGAATGRLQLIENPSLKFDVNSMSVNGLGSSNQIIGLANFIVTGDDSGTAAFEGVGSVAGDFTNVDAITFNNVAHLEGSIRVNNSMVVSSTGSLSGALVGNNGNDTFLVQGFVESINGSEGRDTVTLDGGYVQSADGGSAFFVDRLLNVEDPLFSDPLGLSGSGSNVGSWVNFENVTEAQPVVLINSVPSDINAINVPLVQPVNVNGLQTAALGLFGGGDELRLPCGYAGAPADVPAGNADVDCNNKFYGPEYQKLISSLIHFDNDSSSISAASAARLDKIATFFIESNRFEQLQLSGHADSNASEAYNLRLSERRVASTSNYLQNKGVSEDAIEGFAFGESLPGKPNNSAENRAYNRRVHVELKN